MRVISVVLPLLSVSGAFALIGCSNEERPAPPPSTMPAAASNDVPAWVEDPTDGGKYPIAAYGVAERTLAGEQQQKTRALEAVRTEIARGISSKVQAVFKEWTREGGEITSTENRQTAMTMSENVARTVTDQVISGVSQRGRHVDEKTGRLYVWSYLDAKALDTLNQQIQAQTRTQLDKKAHFASKIEADKAYADLDKLVDKALKAQE
jgi:hypothetical protein